MQIMQIGFFQFIFYQYSIIWIQLIFYFLNFTIRWSILGSTCLSYLSKSLHIYNDLKKGYSILSNWYFKLLWNLTFPIIWTKHIHIQINFSHPFQSHHSEQPHQTRTTTTSTTTTAAAVSTTTTDDKYYSTAFTSAKKPNCRQ